MTTKKAEGEGAYFSDIYEKLAAPFDEVFQDTRAGFTFDYITGEQCISRLNETLGVAGWSFEISEYGINDAADEIWCKGNLRANFGGTMVWREQFGSQKLKRRKADGAILDIGFDYKGAATDCLKKCATLIGVGLYLSKKEPPAEREPFQPQARANNGPVRQAGGPGPAPTGALVCATCGQPVKDYVYSANGPKAGQILSAQTIAQRSQQYQGRVLCANHYFEARKQQLDAQNGQQQPPPPEPVGANGNGELEAF